MKERYIKPEVISIGDTIRVTWKEKDVTRSHVGVVATRRIDGKMTHWETAEGITLLSRHGITHATAGGTLYPFPATVTLLEAAPQLETALALF